MNNNHKSRRSKNSWISPRRGFTLIEVLIATTIVSVVLTLVYVILVSTLNAKKFVEEETYLDRVASRLLHSITRDLQGAYMYQLEHCFQGTVHARNGSRVDFVSNSDSLIYMSQDPSDLSEISYFLVPKRNGIFRLIRREDFFVDEDPYNGGIGIALYDRMASFQLRYFQREKDPKKVWDSKADKGIPTAVEVTLGIYTGQEVEQEDEESFDEPEVRLFRSIIKIMVSPQPPPEKKQDKAEDKDKDKNKDKNKR